MFARITLILVVSFVSLVAGSGCGIAEMAYGIKMAADAHDDKENRKAAMRGFPRQWVDETNELRSRGEKLGEFWDDGDGWIGEKSKPLFDAYARIHADSKRTVVEINKLNDKGLVSKDEMQQFDLYNQQNALRWIIAKYREVAGNEAVQACNEATIALQNGSSQNGEGVAAAAYRKVVAVLDGIPDEPVLPTLHYMRLVGVSRPATASDK